MKNNWALWLRLALLDHNYYIQIYCMVILISWFSDKAQQIRMWIHGQNQEYQEYQEYPDEIFMPWANNYISISLGPLPFILWPVCIQGLVIWSWSRLRPVGLLYRSAGSFYNRLMLYYSVVSRKVINTKTCQHSNWYWRFVAYFRYSFSFNRYFGKHDYFLHVELK